MVPRLSDRRHFLRASVALTSLVLISGCGALRSTESARPSRPRIGYVRESLTTVTYDAFRDGLRELGWVDGQNFTIEYRDPEGNRDRLVEQTEELLSIPVDVFVANGPLSANAAARVTATIPIVVNSSSVAQLLVQNIAHPEGNITGITTNNVEAVGKWVELLKEVVPSLRHLAAVGDQRPEGTLPTTFSNRQQALAAAEVLGLQLSWYDVRDLDTLPTVLSAAVAEGADGLVIISGGVFSGGVDMRIALAAARARLPAVGDNRGFAANGGLLAHGVDSAALALRSAAYVDKLLKGARPGDLPIELPTQYNIVVNLNAARELGITVPPSVLARATEIIQ